MEYILIQDYTSLEVGDQIWVIIPNITSTAYPIEVVIETIYTSTECIKFKNFTKQFRMGKDAVLFHLENI